MRGKEGIAKIGCPGLVFSRGKSRPSRAAGQDFAGVEKGEAPEIFLTGSHLQWAQCQLRDLRPAPSPRADFRGAIAGRRSGFALGILTILLRKKPDGAGSLSGGLPEPIVGYIRQALQFGDTKA